MTNFGADLLSAEGCADTVLKMAQGWIDNVKAIKHVVLLPEMATNFLSVNRVIAFVSSIVRTYIPQFVYFKIYLMPCGYLQVSIVWGIFDK